MNRYAGDDMMTTRIRDEDVDQLVSMGFLDVDVRSALQIMSGNLEMAVSYLISGDVNVNNDGEQSGDAIVPTVLLSGTAKVDGSGEDENENDEAEQDDNDNDNNDDDDDDDEVIAESDDDESDDDNYDNELFIDNCERREAEFEFIIAAYTPEEAWIVNKDQKQEEQVEGNDDDGDDDDKNHLTIITKMKKKKKKRKNKQKARIHRILELPLIIDDVTTTNDNDNPFSSSGSSCGDEDHIYNNNDNNNSSSIFVELILTLPHKYPTDENAVLEIDASLMNNHSTKKRMGNLSVASNNSIAVTTNISGGGGSYRKLAMNALPSLLQACRIISKEYAGYESVFIVLSRADEWINQEWTDILSSAATVAAETAAAAAAEFSTDHSTTAATTTTTLKSVIISRTLLYSHHIIAKSKRKAIKDTASYYNIGGYYKIGWPGIIIIEGEENNATDFIDEIRCMKWQHLECRGEEQQTIQFEIFNNGTSVQYQKQQQINNHRKFVVPDTSRSTNTSTSTSNSKPLLKMDELGEDEMSKLSKICTTVGLRDLFMTSMKIYKNDGQEQQDDNDNDNDSDNNNSNDNGNGTDNNNDNDHDNGKGTDKSSKSSKGGSTKNPSTVGKGTDKSSKSSSKGGSTKNPSTVNDNGVPAFVVLKMKKLGAVEKKKKKLSDKKKKKKSGVSILSHRPVLTATPAVTLSVTGDSLSGAAPELVPRLSLENSGPILQPGATSDSRSKNEVRLRLQDQSRTVNDHPTTDAPRKKWRPPDEGENNKRVIDNKPHTYNLHIRGWVDDASRGIKWRKPEVGENDRRIIDRKPHTYNWVIKGWVVDPTVLPGSRAAQDISQQTCKWGKTCKFKRCRFKHNDDGDNNSNNNGNGTDNDNDGDGNDDNGNGNVLSTTTAAVALSVTDDSLSAAAPKFVPRFSLENSGAIPSLQTTNSGATSPLLSVTAAKFVPRFSLENSGASPS